MVQDAPKKTYRPNEPYVFVSYSHADADRIQPILDRMCHDGYNVWYDQELKGGQDWSDILAMQIENSEGIIIFLSSRTVLSSNCKDELQFAKNSQKPIFPVYLEKITLPGGFKLMLSGSHAVQFNSTEAFFRSLYEFEPMKRCLPRDPDPAEEAPAAASQVLSANSDQRISDKIPSSKWRIRINALIVLAVLLVCFFTVHIWSGPACSSDTKCIICGKYPDTYAEHSFGELYHEYACVVEQTCSECGIVLTQELEHQWSEPDDDCLITCYRCGRKEVISPTEHAAYLCDVAAEYARNRQYRLAIQMLDDAYREYAFPELYKAAVQYRKEFAIDNTSVLAAGKLNSILVHSNRTVTIVGDAMHREPDAETWTDIVSVGMGDRYVIGMQSDGKILIAGQLEEIANFDFSSWENVVAFSAGDIFAVALLEDGTVVSAGLSDHNHDDMETLMREAGDMQIVAVSAGHYQTLALLENGRVIPCGDNATGAMNVFGWTQIAAIYTGTNYSAGLRTDGTVLVTENSWDVSGWTDIVNLAAGDYFLLGLKSDGTVLAAGDYEKWNIDVSQWRNIVRIAAGHDHAVAIDADGNVFSTGSNQKDQFFPIGMVVK